PFLGTVFDSFLDAGAKRELLAVDTLAEHRRALMRHSAIKLVGGVRKQLDAVLDELSGDCIKRDAGFFEVGEDVPGILDVFLKAVAWLAVIAEGVERRRWHGIDRVGTDQLLDIENVAVFLVLGAGRGPQQSLRSCALGRKLLPSRAREQPLIFLVG